MSRRRLPLSPDAIASVGALFENPRSRLRAWASRASLAELSGALGDLGLFIPLFLGANKVHAIQPMPALFWAGMFNVLSGLFWDLPMCVQPMKTIAAAAINGDLNAHEVTVAGMLVSAIVAVLGLTRTIALVNRLLPISLVRGIQLGFGLQLVSNATKLMFPATAGWSGYATGQGLGFGTAIAALAMLQRETLPTALILFLIGIGIAGARIVSGKVPLHWSVGTPVHISTGDISWAEVQTATWSGALPQLPLTILNSVIAVTQLAHDLKPDALVSAEAVCGSVGLLNLVGCPLGAMPMCHGAGGLAGQWKFGARTGVAVVMLGLAKVALAIVGGPAFVKVLTFFPSPLLGTMLAFAGGELAAAGLRGDFVAPRGAPAADVRRAKDNILVCLATAGFTLGLGTGQGCLAGLAVRLVHEARDRLEARAPWCKPSAASLSEGDERTRADAASKPA